MDPSIVHPGALRRLADEHCILLAGLAAQGFMIFFMSVLVQPLIYAHLSGLHVIGAELPSPLLAKRAVLPLMENWAEAAWGVGTAATTFLIGQYENGPRVGVAVLPFVPREADIVRTPAALRRARQRWFCEARPPDPWDDMYVYAVCVWDSGTRACSSAWCRVRNLTSLLSRPRAVFSRAAKGGPPGAPQPKVKCPRLGHDF